MMAARGSGEEGWAARSGGRDGGAAGGWGGQAPAGLAEGGVGVARVSYRANTCDRLN